MTDFPQFRTLRWLVCEALDRDRGGFAATDAERGNAALEVVGLERMQQRHDQPGTGGPDGMAGRAGCLDGGFGAGVRAGLAAVTLVPSVE